MQNKAQQLLQLLHRELTREDLRLLPAADLRQLDLLMCHWSDLIRESCDCGPINE